MNTYKLSADDRLDLHELISRYYEANDEKDIDGALSFCTPDATITGDFEMRADHQQEDLKKIYAGEPGKKRHLMLNPIILSATENEVHMQHLLLVIEASVFPAAVATSKVTDVIRRTPDGWKIAQHRIEVDPSGKWMVSLAQKVQNAVETVKEKLS